MVVYRVENQHETNTSHPTLLQLLCCVLLYFLLTERFPPGRRMEAHKIQEVNKRHVCGKLKLTRCTRPLPKAVETANNHLGLIFYHLTHCLEIPQGALGMQFS